MALAWTIIILIATLRNVNSYSGAFSSQSDFPRIPKIEKQSDKRDHCPSSCKCDNLNKNMIINCGYKKLSLFPPNLSQSVVHLNLVGNDLMKLTYNYSLNTLNLLNVSQNNILEIDFQWLKSLKSLKFLDLSNNELFSSSIKFSEQNSLVHLDLSSNSLSFVADEMFQQMNSLSFLNISHNSIQNVSQNAFDDLINIKILDISHNKLTDIHHEWLKNLKNLQILILKKNNIQLLRNVVFSALKNLQVLDLSENNIKPVGLLSFKGLFQLEFLNLSSNSISHFQDGVFRSLELLKTLDLSQNPITSLDNILIHTKNLEFLYLKELEKFKELNSKSLLGTQKLNLLDLSGSKELSDINLNAFHNSKNLKSLDISNSNLTSLRSGIFSKLQNLETLKLNGNPWKCDCYMYWLLMWLAEHTNSHLFSPSDTFCNTPSNLRGQVLLDALDHSMICTNASIHHHTNVTKFKVGSPALLECKVEGNPLPSLTWITPQKEAFYWTSFSNLTKKSDTAVMSTEFPNDYKGRYYVTSDGNLAIQNVQRGDGGFFVCIASNPLSYDSVSIRLTLDYEYLVHIKIISVLVGTATSFSFLLLTLVAVLIKMILKHFNIRCPCHNGNASPRTQQIKKILESMEHYKKQQLDRLRDNYNGQVLKIKDNCMQQMERLRESYSSQSERLRDIKDYGTLQIDRIRENYYSQVQRVRDYSASQIIRLRENYLFQRNRIRKFSAHHLYKLRENYKVQQQHLNKILENLNIESCRNVCQRTDSIVFEPDITLENVLVPKICLQTLTKRTCDYDNSSQISAYFTPDEAGSEISGHESDEPDSFEHTCKRKPCEREVSIIIEKSEVSSIPERDLTEIDFSVHTCKRKPCEREVSNIEKSEVSSIPERDLTDIDFSVHTCKRKPPEKEVSIIKKSEVSTIPQRDLTEIEQSDVVEQYSTETIV